MTTTAPTERPTLTENDRLAARLRVQFERRGVLCLNLISAPGSGKTTLLESTLRGLPAGTRAAVLTGDIQTDNDARRIARAGYPVKQISTGGICHLDAAMVTEALADWDLDTVELLFIENVGNLVCPTAYDLGEHAKVVLLSVAEGDDKPEKYPGIYRRAALSVITKSDLLPYVDFSVAAARAHADRVRPGLPQIVVSCRTGAGLDAWQAWLRQRRTAATAWMEVRR